MFVLFSNTNGVSTPTNREYVDKETEKVILRQKKSCIKYVRILAMGRGCLSNSGTVDTF